MTVKFENVGRDKKTWSADVSSLSDAELIRSIRKQGALASRDIAFEWSEEGTSAQIYVGGFRCVGSISIDAAIKLTPVCI